MASVVSQKAMSVPAGKDLADRLAAEKAAALRRGECPHAEQYLERHPELAQNAEAALRLIYEETCLRQEHGRHISFEELSRRFPQWSPELSVLLECHGLMKARLAPLILPGPGE